jgi:hypothetical protein
MTTDKKKQQTAQQPTTAPVAVAQGVTNATDVPRAIPIDRPQLLIFDNKVPNMDEWLAANVRGREPTFFNLRQRDRTGRWEQLEPMAVLKKLAKMIETYNTDGYLQVVAYNAGAAGRLTACLELLERAEIHMISANVYNERYKGERRIYLLTVAKKPSYPEGVTKA